MPRFPLAAAAVPSFTFTGSSPSTNAELLRADAPHGTVLATDDQTAGRGRLDRRWVAPAGSALAVTVVLRPTTPAGTGLEPTRGGWIPLLAGLAMVEALDAALAAPAWLKWPNDVLVGAGADARKLCGILVELAADGAFVVGAGLNTRMTVAQLPVATATSLAIAAGSADDAVVDAVLARYLAGLLGSVAALADADGDAARAGLDRRVAERCGTLGAPVRVELPGGGELRGTALALDPQGRLRVRTDTGREDAVAAGDVVHLR